MDETTLPRALREALAAKTLGATGVARLVIAGLLELVHDPEAVGAATAYLTERLPGYAPVWHIARAVHATDPATRLCGIRDELDEAVPKSVAAAARWVREHARASVATAPSSAIVAQVMALLGEGTTAGEPATGLAGADAIGPEAVLNIRGTYDLARRVPTLVVTTSLKLVPEPVFARLGAPAFERIPLELFAGVVLDGEILSPAQAGLRAAALSE